MPGFEWDRTRISKDFPRHHEFWASGRGDDRAQVTRNGLPSREALSPVSAQLVRRYVSNLPLLSLKTGHSNWTAAGILPSSMSVKGRGQTGKSIVYRVKKFSDGSRNLRRTKKEKAHAHEQKTRALQLRNVIYRPKYLALRSVKLFHFSGKSSNAKIADTGQTGTQAPQSMHSTGSMYNISSSAYAGLSFFGWIQSTGQASTHAVSLVPMHGSAIT